MHIYSIQALVYCRNWKYEQELASLLWKIDYKDISFREQYGGGSIPVTGTMGRVCDCKIFYLFQAQFDR